MQKKFIRLKQFIRSSNNGFTLIELLVAILIASIVLGIALQIAIYNRKLYLEDQARNRVNQNLRAVMDIVGADVRQAGEQIGDSSFPVITIEQDDTDVTGVKASELVIRRNLLGITLPVCNQINAGSNRDNVFIADNSGSPPAGCSPQADTDGDGWPDNLDLWRNYRLTHGGEVRAYIYNGNGNGEFFTYDAEDNSGFKIHKGNSERWQYDYNTNNAKIYLLEERRYRICPSSQLTQNSCTSSRTNGNNVLQLVTNGDYSTPTNLVSALTGFQVQAFMQDGTVQSTFPATGYNWSQLKNIRVDIAGSDPSQGTLITTKQNIAKRQISAVFFPRNIISR